MSELPTQTYSDWAATCDTLHAHTQLLGKFAVALAAPEPQLQHAALRLTARGWETPPLPNPDGTGTFAITLDLRGHQAVVENSAGAVERIPLTPNRAVAHVTRDVIAAAARLAGPAELNLTPQEVSWTTPLDQDVDHATYDEAAVSRYFAMATSAAQALARYRAPYRGRSTPVNAWWGSFDLAVSLFSGDPATPPSRDFIQRNSMDAQEVAVGWWPGDTRYPKAAFYAYAYPAPDGFTDAVLDPAAARYDATLGEFLLDWDDLRGSANPADDPADDPVDDAVVFARSAFAHACTRCDWPSGLAASAESTPPPVS